MAFCGLLSEYSDRIVRELHPIPYYPAPRKEASTEFVRLFNYGNPIVPTFKEKSIPF